MAKTDEAKPDDAEAEAGSETASAKSRFSLKFILMAAGGVVALAALGGGGYFFFFHHAATAAPSAATAQAKPPIFLDMPEVLVNLSGTSGDRAQYLKVKIALEVADDAVSAQIQPIMPRLLDTFQTYLRELRPIDLDGSAGLYRLKEELTRRVNASIAPSRVSAVLFKEIVVQ
jgi:flagellar protein FliL